LPATIAALVAALATLATAWALGRLLSRHQALSAPTHLAAGAAVLGTTVFLLLAGGLVRRASFVALTIIVLGAAAWRERDRRPRICLPGGPPWAILGILGVFGVVYWFRALAPDLEPDSAGYHLGLVNEWMRTRVLADRVGFYEMLPHGLEMLFLHAFAFGKHSAATLLHFGLLVATVPLMFRVAARFGLPRWAGAAAAVFYFTSPVVAIDGTSGYNDAALAFFTLAVFDLIAGCAPAWVAGLCAGFCYSIKMTGAVAILGGLVWLAVQRRRPRPVLLFGAAALAMMLPWMLRNQVMAANPVAPFLSGIFPSPAFHASQEQALRANVNKLDLESLAQLPVEITVRGATAGGLLGPVFLLMPLALVALRDRQGRLLLGAAVVAALPWLANSGTRFLIPALPFASLALGLGLDRIAPRRGPALVAVLAAAACWPGVVVGYAAPFAWTIRQIPWRVVLGLETRQQYIEKSADAAVAAMVDRHIQPNDLVYDPFGLPWAYVRWIPMGTWNSAAANRVTMALETAERKPPFHEVVMRWPAAAVAALRIRPSRPWPDAWSAVEVVALANGAPLAPQPDWRTTAGHYPAEAGYALDGNFVTEYRSWEPARPEMYWELRLDKPATLDGARIVSRSIDPGAIEVLGESAAGGAGWRKLSRDYTQSDVPVVDLRRSAIRVARREGLRWLILPSDNSPFKRLTRAMIADPEGWGLVHVDSMTEMHLFRIK
jgi:hypothetical protein